MEEFFLDLFLAGEKLYVINNKDVCATVEAREVSVLFKAQRINKLLNKLFGTNIDNPAVWVCCEYRITDRLDEVCFSDADTPVEEQRVIFFTRLGGYGLAGCVCQFATRADDEVVERIAFVQPLS